MEQREVLKTRKEWKERQGDKMERERE